MFSNTARIGRLKRDISFLSGTGRRRSFASNSSLYIAGQGWTGALGSGSSTMINSTTSAVTSTERETNFKVTSNFDNVTDVAAGWGHTALINDGALYVAGRPWDFQSLLRLNRLPSFLRRMVLRQSLSIDKSLGDEGGLLGIAIEFFFRNEADKEYTRAVLPDFVEMKLPDGDIPLVAGDFSYRTLAASAGLTAIIGSSGNVYTFGLNMRGQCGVGVKTSNHVWFPTPVALKTEMDVDVDLDKSDSEVLLENIKSVDLGLQHGLALDCDGNLYAWGKGARGQLGKSDFKSFHESDDDTKESTIDLEFAAIPINEFEVITTHRSLLTGNDARVKSMSAGWNHSAAITESNHVWVWGKNAIAEIDDKDESVLKAKDAPAPTMVQGLPSGVGVKNVSCGSHHTAILMEDNSIYAIGISTDTVEPISQTAVQIIPPGILDTPIQQFTSHFDRTTIVAENGRQVLEVQLWSTEELRETAVFEPEWVEPFFDNNNKGIQQVERGWLHTTLIS